MTKSLSKYFKILHIKNLVKSIYYQINFYAWIISCLDLKNNYFKCKSLSQILLCNTIFSSKKEFYFDYPKCNYCNQNIWSKIIFIECFLRVKIESEKNLLRSLMLFSTNHLNEASLSASLIWKVIKFWSSENPFTRVFLRFFWCDNAFK